MGCSSSHEASSYSPKATHQTGKGQQGAQGNGQAHTDLYKLSKATLDKREQALVRAEQLFAQTRGKRFHDNYVRCSLVSYGASCKVLTCVHRQTNKKYAAKAIPKDAKNPEKQHCQVLLEIGVMQEVEDHPNAVQLFEVYDEAKQYYLVMEYCEGGELFDHISKSQKGLTERQAAQILTSIMQFLAHMHSKGIAHMDIKPENIMFDSEGAKGILKIIDFGASVYLLPNEAVKDAFGTVRYSSPEMANDVGIGHKTDVWSAGVVMYVMLCGSAPFLKGSEVDTLNLIKKAPRVKFSGSRWSHISQAAKDCIKAMLEPHPDNRPTAADVLTYAWLRSTVPDNTIRPDILSHLRAFANQSRMRRMLLGLMASNLTGGEANRLLSQFYMVDTDSSGTIELPELVQAAQKVLPDVSEEEVARVFSALDVDSTGTIDLREFFAGLLHTMDSELQQQLAYKSFSTMDKGSAGSVPRDVFVGAMVERAKTAGLCVTIEEEASLRQELEEEFQTLDVNHDGVLSFEEYRAAMSASEQDQAPDTTTELLPADIGELAAAAAGVIDAAARGAEEPPASGTAAAASAPGPPEAESSGGETAANELRSASGRQASASTTRPGSRQISARDRTRRASSRAILAHPALEELLTDSQQEALEALATSHQNLIRLAMEVQDQQRTKSGMAQHNRHKSGSGLPTRISLVNTHSAVAPGQATNADPSNSLAHIALSSSAPAPRASGPMAATAAEEALGGAASSTASASGTAAPAVRFLRSGSYGHGGSAAGYDPAKEAAMHAVASLLERQRVTPDLEGALDGADAPRRSAPARTAGIPMRTSLQMDGFGGMGGGVGSRSSVTLDGQSATPSGRPTPPGLPRPASTPHVAGGERGAAEGGSATVTPRTGADNVVTRHESVALSETQS